MNNPDIHSGSNDSHNVVNDEMRLQPEDCLSHIEVFIRNEFNLASVKTENELLARVGDIIITITPKNGHLSVDFARFMSQQQPDGSQKKVFDSESIGDSLQENTIDLVHVLKKLLQYLVVDLDQNIIVDASTEKRRMLYERLVKKMFPDHLDKFTFGLPLTNISRMLK